MNEFQTAYEIVNTLQQQRNELEDQILLALVVPLMRILGPNVQIEWDFTSEYDDNNYYTARTDIALQFSNDNGTHRIEFGEPSNLEDISEWLSNPGAFDNIDDVPTDFDENDDEHWALLSKALGMPMTLEKLEMLARFTDWIVDESVSRYSDSCTIDSDILKKARLELANGAAVETPA